LDVLTQAVGLDRFALYLHDYGCPIGLHLALLHPNRVTGLIVQDGNAYEEGLGPQWDTAKAYWREPTLENREHINSRSAQNPLRLPIRHDAYSTDNGASLSASHEKELGERLFGVVFTLLSELRKVRIKVAGG